MKIHTDYELSLIRGAADFCGHKRKDYTVRDATAIHIAEGEAYRYYNPLDATSPDFLAFVSRATGLLLEVNDMNIRATYDGRYRVCPMACVAEELAPMVVKLVLKSKKTVDSAYTPDIMATS